MSGLEAMLSFEEGTRYVAYPDPLTGGAPYTIGKGHTGPEVRLGLRWTDAQIETAFESDIAIAEHGIAINLPWVAALDDARRAVIVAMVFQMGIGKVLKFVNTLAYAKAGRFHDAAQGLRSSAWASQTPARAHREADQFETGKWDPHYA